MNPTLPPAWIQGDSRTLDRARRNLPADENPGSNAMERTRLAYDHRLRLGALAAALVLALAACGNDDARGGVQSSPARVTAVSPPPAPVPAPVAPPGPAPLPDYTGTPCTVLPAIADPPTMIGKPVADPAYNALKDAGAAAVPCLVLALTDPRPLDHPQSLPGAKADFSVGDLAFFLLVDFGHVDFLRALPPEVSARVPDRGAFAYFDWIGVPGSRERLQARVREQVATAPTAAAPGAPLKR
jgi:hypothetical protein